MPGLDGVGDRSTRGRSHSGLLHDPFGVLIENILAHPRRGVLSVLVAQTFGDLVNRIGRYLLQRRNRLRAEPQVLVTQDVDGDLSHVLLSLDLAERFVDRLRDRPRGLASLGPVDRYFLGDRAFDPGQFGEDLPAYILLCRPKPLQRATQEGPADIVLRSLSESAGLAVG